MSLRGLLKAAGALAGVVVGVTVLSAAVTALAAVWPVLLGAVAVCVVLAAAAVPVLRWSARLAVVSWPSRVKGRVTVHPPLALPRPPLALEAATIVQAMTSDWRARVAVQGRAGAADDVDGLPGLLGAGGAPGSAPPR